MKSFFIILSIAYLFAFQCHGDLTIATNNYIDFIKEFGSSTVELPHVEKLFSNDLKITINGNEFLENCDSYLEKLKFVKNFVQGWDIQVCDLFLSNEENRCVIHYLCFSQGNCFSTTSLITFNSNYLVTEINTVYSEKKTNQKDWYEFMTL